MKSDEISFGPHHNWMTRFEDGVTGLSKDASEGKWVLVREIEIPWTYKVYGNLRKKSKRT